MHAIDWMLEACSSDEMPPAASTPSSPASRASLEQADLDMFAYLGWTDTKEFERLEGFEPRGYVQNVPAPREGEVRAARRADASREDVWPKLSSRSAAFPSTSLADQHRLPSWLCVRLSSGVLSGVMCAS